ncbi:MAG: type III pantothenate kinase [Proteobacteria bacterium]|nr:type III pantothenate kinase [Pseudomonadota bacterium]
MLFVADVGNVHTVLGLFRGDVLVERWRVATDKVRTADEWGLNFKAFFELGGHALTDVRGAAICSVVPPVSPVLRAACRKYLNADPLEVGPGVKTGLAIRCDNPREVGSDRIVNAVAARALTSSACIVVDMGTATTFDCVSARGEYLGGAICPGLRISLEALVSRAARLPRIEIARPENAIGRNTEHAMQSGILFGYAALVDGLIARLEAEMGEPVEVIATGGLCTLIAEECQRVHQAKPDLTLDGLRLVYAKNVP